MDIIINDESFKFRMFGVGQGLFCYVEQTKNGDKHGYVFDCGGKKQLVNGHFYGKNAHYKMGKIFNIQSKKQPTLGAIDRFIEYIVNQKVTLDYIIVSHMHKDHMSGITNLINQLREIKQTSFKILLPNFNISPHFTKEFYMSYLVDNNFTPKELVHNPLMYSYAFKFIDSAEINQLSIKFETSEKDELKRKIDKSELEKKQLENDRRNAEDKDEKKRLSNKIRGLTVRINSLTNQQHGLKEYWESLRENYQIVTSNLSEIEMEITQSENDNIAVSKLYDNRVIIYEQYFDNENFYKEIKGVLEHVSLTSFLENKDSLQKIEQIYKNHKIANNKFSLIIKDSIISTHDIILSGDIPWTEKLCNIIDKSKRLLYQISHHGAYKENKIFIELCGNIVDYGLFSFGYNNTWRHPDFRTIATLTDAKTKLHYATCFNDNDEFNQDWSEYEIS